MFPCHFMKSNGLNSTQRNLNQNLAEDIMMTFLLSSNQSAGHLSKLRDYFNTYHLNMSFSFEQEKKWKFVIS